MKRIGMAVAASLLILGFAVTSRAGYSGRSDETWQGGGHVWSVAPKLIVFFPNSSNPGLNNYGPGVGIGVDGRYNFIKYFAVAGELDYIGASSATINGATANFSNFAVKVDALGTIPLNRITPFFGLGLVYNNPSVSVSGGGYSNSLSGSGIGLELVGGADFIVTKNGAVTAQISIPISQGATFNGSSTTVDVGVYELMAGYRFLF
ncbi:MAG: porin family protein [Deltaproteobacteria bacterium]|nr:porin family protein [Deltaproteobacteria bacterium]MCL5277314.1 porin family protein [Deltaproteobacteria bacterium]